MCKKRTLLTLGLLAGGAAAVAAHRAGALGGRTTLIEDEATWTPRSAETVRDSAVDDVPDEAVVLGSDFVAAEGAGLADAGPQVDESAGVEEAIADEVAEDEAVAAPAPAGSEPQGEPLDLPAPGAAAEAAPEAPAESDDEPEALPDGAHAATADGSEPEGFPIKGNRDSMLYHLPGSRFYERTVAEIWFATAEQAEAAGYKMPKSQRKDS